VAYALEADDVDDIDEVVLALSLFIHGKALPVVGFEAAFDNNRVFDGPF